MSKQSDMTSFERVLYTSKTHTKSGRERASQSSDRCLDIKLSIRGSAEVGTNPEQLFAAGWAACFIGAMGLAAIKPKVMLAAETSVDAEVNLSTTDSAYFFAGASSRELAGHG
jgi:lipoyl-dependent peroxiredoxin